MIKSTEFHTLLKEYLVAIEDFQRRFTELRNRKKVSNGSVVDMPQPAEQDISIPDGKGLSETLFDGYGDSPDYRDKPYSDSGNNGIWQADFDSK